VYNSFNVHHNSAYWVRPIEFAISPNYESVNCDIISRHFETMLSLNLTIVSSLTSLDPLEILREKRKFAKPRLQKNSWDESFWKRREKEEDMYIDDVYWEIISAKWSK